MKLLLRALIFLFNIIFPQCCLICGNNCEENLCDKCKEKIHLDSAYKIKIKIDSKFYFNKQIYMFQYKDRIRKLILDYKFKDKSYLYKFFSDIIIKNEKIYGILKKYDIMIPVPMYKKRKNERGYNQTELIAKEIVKNIDNLVLENDIIIKKINNKTQSLLTREERFKNVQNVYEVANSEKIKNKRIIILDDVYTTGNTVNSIAKELKDNGAGEILVLTIAKD